MELDKMDENDWKYHGEGNKSLVVSHLQVSVELLLAFSLAEIHANSTKSYLSTRNKIKLHKKDSDK